MKVKTADLIDLSLDWMVAVVEGATRIQLYEYNDRKMIRVSLPDGIYAPWEPSRYWGQGGLIIERERITLRVNACVPGRWAAFIDFGGSNCNIKARQSGPTPLIAAMRCLVASRLGDEVDIPDALKVAA